MTNLAFFAKDHPARALFSSPWNTKFNEILSYSNNFDVLPLSVGLVASSKVVKQPAIHLHKCLENIVDQRHNRLVPMLLTYPAARDSVT